MVSSRSGSGLLFALSSRSTSLCHVGHRQVRDPGTDGPRCCHQLPRGGEADGHFTRHLLVADKGEGVGIISMRDVIRLMLDEKQWLIDELQIYISGR